MQAIDINEHSFSAHFPNWEQFLYESLFPVSWAKMVSGGRPGFLQGQKPEEDSGIAFNNTNKPHL